uniref:Uncharacterized protein n=1 Tax=Physcomitrium patens TaxID=3218 RepID=A0A2K1K6V6_PHYPA|nr:hypothetical protein PHYPA_011407 [Physcomitrium patens]
MQTFACRRWKKGKNQEKSCYVKLQRLLNTTTDRLRGSKGGEKVEMKVTSIVI